MEQPCSPGRGPVSLKECIEELVKFTLESHINKTIGFDLGLSNDFCSNLLKDQPPPVLHTAGQVTSHPSYKHLSSALYECVTTGALSGTCNKMAAFDKENDLKQRGEWKALLLDEGTRLVNIFENVSFELHVQEPFFTQLRDGLKTVEGRCATGDYNRIRPGALILFNKCLVLQVQDVCWYASFSEMLEVESLKKVLPGVNSIAEGVKVYRKFYTEERERSNGVLAISVAKSADQPYICLARILFGLSRKGLESLFYA